jgi:hypothetical protein
MGTKATNNMKLDIENELYCNQQAVENHITRITELQRLIEQEEENLSNKINQSQDIVAKLLSKFTSEH